MIQGGSFKSDRMGPTLPILVHAHGPSVQISYRFSPDNVSSLSSNLVADGRDRHWRLRTGVASLSASPAFHTLPSSHRPLSDATSHARKYNTWTCGCLLVSTFDLVSFHHFGEASTRTSHNHNLGSFTIFFEGLNGSPPPSCLEGSNLQEYQVDA